MSTINLQQLSALTQEHITKNYVRALSEEDKAFLMKSYIRKFLKDNGYEIEGLSNEELVNVLYSDMAEYSVLTEYLNRQDVEEININSWDDIAITYTDGRVVKLAHHFYSPAHAVDVIKRLLHHSGMVIDNATPISQGHLPGNVRITAIKDPIVDEEREIAVSIRMLHTNRINREAIIDSGFATDEMIAFLELCLRFGISVVVAGRTSSGKTTLTNVLLESVPDGKRIYTIESGAREMDLVRKNANGETLNNVVHTLSRPSDNEVFDISQEDLVVSALRFNPDIICVGEMRDSEANAAVEASFTGHTLISTVHSGPGEAAHMRIALLCQRKFAIDFDLSLLQAAQAFPIVAFAHKTEDNKRRLMDITECVINDKGVREYRILYRYVITNNVIVNGEYKSEGFFEKCYPISEGMINRLIQHGVPKESLRRFV